MFDTATLRQDRSAPAPGASLLVFALLIVWAGTVAWLGATGAFIAPAGAPPLRLLTAVLGPVLLFLIAYQTSAAVRDLAQTVDLRIVTATQAWRFGGFVFLALYSYGVLPAYFAWPAGIGDMAIGATTPWMLASLARDPGFAASRRFVIWNVLGILDLIVAVTAGAVVPLLLPGLVGDAPTGAMTRLPLVLIPGLFVPGYLILHAIALAQSSRGRSERR